LSLAAAVLLIDLSVITIGDGSLPVTVNVQSNKSFRLRKVTYGNYCHKEDVAWVLALPYENSKWSFHDARIHDDHSFIFEVPNSDHVSLFGILRNEFSWRRFAVFRIHCEAGEPVFISATLPDPRTTKSLTIKIP
jgi:hypothetical protein